MIAELTESHGNILGFAVTGHVTKADYDFFIPRIQDAIDTYGSVQLCLDLTDFTWENVSAWGSDLKFGKEYHDKIDKMAIVGDSVVAHLVSKAASPFYAHMSRFFTSQPEAWAWLHD